MRIWVEKRVGPLGIRRRGTSVLFSVWVGVSVRCGMVHGGGSQGCVDTRLKEQDRKKVRDTLQARDSTQPC
jgi:hypothetical protein